MSAIAILKALHLLGVAYFFGFLMLDVLVIRRFLNENCHDAKILFYEKAKSSLHVFVTVILVSGFCMLYLLDFNPALLIWLKIIFAITAITLFFASPYIVKTSFVRGRVDLVYIPVLLLAIAVVILAKIPA